MAERPSSSRFSRLVRIALYLALGPTLAGAQGLRVNAPLLRDSLSGGEDVEEYVVAPGGLRVAFLADPEVEGRTELFSAPLAEAGAAVRLSSPGAYCHGPLRITAGAVLYLVQPHSTAIELHAVPLDGRAPSVRLSPDGAKVREHQASASARRAVFLAEPAETSALELWSAPLDGAAPAVRLDLPVVAGGRVRAFRLSPDGRVVLFTADRVTAGVVELWAAPVDARSAAVRLSGALVAGGDVEHFAATPGGARSVFTADAASDGVLELWSAPLDGSAAPVRLNGALVPGGDVAALAPWLSPFRISPDGATVVYQADQATDGVLALWSVPSGGGPALALGGAHPFDGSVGEDFVLTPDGERVVYAAMHAAPGFFHLYAAPLDGAPATRLSETGWPQYHPTPFAPAPDGRRVLYLLDEERSGVTELWSVPVDGAAPRVRLSGALADTGDVLEFRLAGARVLYRADELVDEQHELFSVPATGAAPRVRVSGPLDASGDVVDFAPAPGGLRVLYRADTETDDTFALWSVATTGSGTPVELSMPLDPGPIVGGVSEFVWTADGTRLLYGAPDALERSVRFGVFSAWLGTRGEDGFPVVHVGSGREIVASPDGARCAFQYAPPCEDWPCFATALRVAPSDASAPAEDVASGLLSAREVRFSPDGTRVAYVVDGWSPYGPVPSALFLVPADGSAPPAFLGWNPGPFEFSGDGRSFVYAVEDALELGHLYCRPLDGSPPLALEPPLTDPQQSIRGLRLTGDGRAVFLADPLALGAYELWVAPLDGSAPAVRIGPPGDPLAVLEPDFRLTADDAYAVYVRDRELWSVPLDPARGYVAVRLSEKSAPGRGVVAPLDGRSQFELAPDGSRVAYLHAVEASAVRELWSAPIDGAKAPVRLHAALGYDRGVEPSGFEISADSRWVAFAADLGGAGIRSLYRAPLGGGLAPLELSGPFVPGGELHLNPPGGIRAAFEISADSSWAVYLADQDEDGRVELYSVGLDGVRPPRRLNRHLPAGGDVESFALQPAGAWVAYRADQERNDEVELFASALDVGHALPAGPPRPLR